MKSPLVVLVAVVAAVTLTSAAAAGPTDRSSRSLSSVSWNGSPRPRPSRSGRARTGRCAASPWSRAPSTTPSTRSMQPQAVPARPQQVRVGRRASQDAAVATAAYRVLLAITPTTRHEGLGTSYQATLAAIPDGPSEQGGVRAGEAAAAAMIAAVRTMGSWLRLPRHWHRSRQVEADRVAEHAGVRSRRLGRQPEAVPDQGRCGVPHERPERADERCLRDGLRRGEGGRLYIELDAYG